MRGREWTRRARAKALSQAKARGRALGVIHGEKWVRRSAVTPCPCSSWCCGNPRRWFGEATMAEHRAPTVDDDW